MTTYLHDGSMDGYLCALYRAVRGGAAGDAVGRDAGQQPDMFARTETVPPDTALARGFLGDIRERSAEAARRVLDVYMADRVEAGAAVVAYVRLVEREGGAVDGWETHEAVARVLAVSRAVRKECHAFKGLLRFRELADGLLWAPFRPDANIAAALAPYFRRRNAGDAWLIHDLRRRVGVLWDRRDLVWLAGADLPAAGETSATERAIAEIWRTFHGSVAIPERHNPSLQRRNMPARYWEYLVEMAGPDG